MNPVTSRPTSDSKLPKTYAGLMALHLLRPIRDRLEAENAAEMMDRLAGHALNEEQSDYLDLLSDLHAKWEESQQPWRRASGTELLRLLLAEHGVGAPYLAKLLGIDISLAYRLLRGERRLTAAQIRRIAETHGLEPGALLA